ncbi:MAG: 2-dehydro-3-deoxyphosphogluconate aldolase [Anaerolineae bacterium SG8_19]|jgi:2-dehydro-3-deoxyphosphogluconate aldolase/(4S)-4-hydroxy-2-oxoglutarate aldolase|nr:MAG: 2-dehydro-3-deoxyphosphogluconate aldolase [Anaerolineae bacterium SG8_19]HCB50289.1 2-dehydro-3-deoxyphosphogluconate aldolase [Chloroflexota bacterium]
MSKQTTLDTIRQLGLLSVLRGPSFDLTLQMVDALVAGGVWGIEITFTTPNALEVVKSLDRRFGDQILLGMGTLTKPEQAAAAKEAGARFLVSPHCEKSLAGAMKETGLPIMLGALTPSEVILSRKLGSDVVKLFPGSLGGPEYLKALRGPFPDIPIMPTGGVSQDNVSDWFAAGAFAVGAGSNLCPTALAQERRFGEITALAKAFVQAVASARSPVGKL